VMTSGLTGRQDLILPIQMIWQRLAAVLAAFWLGSLHRRAPAWFVDPLQPARSRRLGNDPFAVLLADDFLTYEGAGVTADLVKCYQASGRTQLSVMEVNGPETSKYGVVQPGAAAASVAGLVEKPAFELAPSNLASIGRYVLTPDNAG
jgi:NDP-sugar pyrophosphorylase family protein